MATLPLGRTRTIETLAAGAPGELTEHLADGKHARPLLSLRIGVVE